MYRKRTPPRLAKTKFEIRFIPVTRIVFIKRKASIITRISLTTPCENPAEVTYSPLVLSILKNFSTIAVSRPLYKIRRPYILRPIPTRIIFLSKLSTIYSRKVDFVFRKLVKRRLRIVVVGTSKRSVSCFSFPSFPPSAALFIHFLFSLHSVCNYTKNYSLLKLISRELKVIYVYAFAVVNSCIFYK